MPNRQQKDGSFPSEKPRSASPYSQLQQLPGVGAEFAWQDVDPELIRYAITVVTDRGDAISFAVNRNRTAGSITILAGAERPRFYVNTVVEANALLTQIIQSAH